MADKDENARFVEAGLLDDLDDAKARQARLALLHIVDPLQSQSVGGQMSGRAPVGKIKSRVR